MRHEYRIHGHLIVTHNTECMTTGDTCNLVQGHCAFGVECCQSVTSLRTLEHGTS